MFIGAGGFASLSYDSFANRATARSLNHAPQALIVNPERLRVKQKGPGKPGFLRQLPGAQWLS
jgi:hypothetical protein